MIGRIYTKVITDKMAWDAWMKTGSTYKAPEYLFRVHGITSPRNKGKLVSHAGVAIAAYRYMLDNPVEARKDLDDSMKANGVLLTDEHWYELIYRKSLYVSKKRRNEFLVQHPHYRPYFEQIRAKIEQSKKTS